MWSEKWAVSPKWVQLQSWRRERDQESGRGSALVPALVWDLGSGLLVPGDPTGFLASVAEEKLNWRACTSRGPGGLAEWLPGVAISSGCGASVQHLRSRLLLSRNMVLLTQGRWLLLNVSRSAQTLHATFLGERWWDHLCSVLRRPLPYWGLQHDPSHFLEIALCTGGCWNLVNQNLVLSPGMKETILEVSCWIWYNDLITFCTPVVNLTCQKESQVLFVRERRSGFSFQFPRMTAVTPEAGWGRTFPSKGQAVLPVDELSCTDLKP